MEIVDTHIHFWTPDTHSWVHLLKGTKFGKKLIVVLEIE